MSRGQMEMPRAALIAALNDEANRKASTAAIMYQLAIADRLGLGLTDLVCGEILSRTGAITAGELAELSGLTTGAITGVVDRLEKGGFVRRVNDPNDRRRVMLEPIAERFYKISGNPYDALEKRFNALYAEYSDDDLALLLEFLRKSITIMDEEAVRLRAKNAVRESEPPAAHKPHLEANIRARMDAQAHIHTRAEGDALIQIHRGKPKIARTFSAPRGTITAARLDWVSGSMHLMLRGARNLSELYLAEFKHDVPIVRDQEGIVSVQYRHRTLFGRGGGAAEVKLNAGVKWDVNIECGASHLEADLRELALGSFAFKSKTSKLTLLLPPPSGTIHIRIESALSNIRIERPKLVPLRLEFQGEWAAVRFDRSRFNVSDETRESPDYKRAANRYVLECVGGGSKLIVEESKG